MGVSMIAMPRCDGVYDGEGEAVTSLSAVKRSCPMTMRTTASALSVAPPSATSSILRPRTYVPPKTAQTLCDAEDGLNRDRQPPPHRQKPCASSPAPPYCPTRKGELP